MKKRIFGFCAAALIAGQVSLTCPATAGNVLGEPVADFELVDLTGNAVSLSQHLGEVVVLNFFATWCAGCNDEAEILELDIWQAFRDDGVTVIAVDIMEQAPLVQGWAAALGVTYEIWLAPDWALLQEFPQSLAIPYNAVLDRELVLRYAQIGFDEIALVATINDILAEDQVPNTTTSWGDIKAIFR